MRRFMVLVTVALLMSATLVIATAEAAGALTLVGRVPRFTAGSGLKAVSSGGVPVEPASVCQTVAGVGGFELRDGRTVCWLNSPVPLPLG
jgi:hypothetical protein